MRRLAKVVCLITTSALSSASSPPVVPTPQTGFAPPNYRRKQRDSSRTFPFFLDNTKPRIRNWDAVRTDPKRRDALPNLTFRAHRIAASSMEYNGNKQNTTHSLFLEQPLPHKTAETPSTALSTHNPILHDLPRHIAFICDGNSRWAERNSLPKSMGHAAGADRVMNLLKTLQTQSRWQQQQQQRQQLDPDENNVSNNENDNRLFEHKKEKHVSRIEYCTLFAFSTENWSRPTSEISTIMKLMEQMAVRYRDTAIREGNIQIKVLGDLDDERIPEGTRRELRKLEYDTMFACQKHRNQSTLDDTYQDENERFDVDNHDILTIYLAINYGGRADILNAAQKLAQSIASGEILSSNPDGSIQESELSKHLSTRHLPDPDLIIRTGGEKRLSNFLLWNAAYAELYFSDLLWPDFDDDALEEALIWYGTRNRRFGGRKEVEL